MVKYFASIVFIFHMIFYNAVVLYLPALALQSIVGLSKLYSVLIIGVLGVLYSAFGGIKAVVWTDLFQATLMYASLLTVAIMGTYEAGGFANVLEEATRGERLDLDDFFELDFTTRHTLLGILLGSTLKHVILVGANQVQIQRALALPSLRQGQLALVLCSIFTATFTLLSTYTGLAMYSAYRSCDPYLGRQIPSRDGIIVHYVATRLRRVPGARGIFFAGLFSATLSTLSSFANSMSALAIEDFIKPMRRALARRRNAQSCNISSAQTRAQHDTNGSGSPWLAKLLATLFGLICVVAAYSVDKVNSRFLQATSTAFGAIGVPFLAAFLLGIYTRLTNTIGIMVGLVATLIFGTYVTLYQVFFMARLQPKLPVYYNEQCQQVFNMTMSSSKLMAVDELYASEMVAPKLAKLEEPFAVEKISYMILPFVQFVLTSLIAIFVSLLTKGYKQHVPNDCLATSMQSGSATDEQNGIVRVTSNGKSGPSLGEFSN